MTTKPSPTKINQPLSFFHGHMQPWNIPTTITTYKGAQVSRCPERQAKENVGFPETALKADLRGTGTTAMSKLTSHTLQSVTIAGITKLQDCQFCWFSLAVNSLRRNRARRHGWSCSTSISYEPILSALVLPQTDQPKCKMKLAGYLLAKLIFWF